MTSLPDLSRREFLGVGFATSAIIARPGLMRLMRAEPVALAMLGSGARGRAHLATLHGVPWATLVAVSDPDGHARDAFLRDCWEAGMATGARATDAELLEDPAIGAVILAAPAMTNARLALAAMDAGKHVYVEPPAALDGAMIATLARAAEKAGVVLQHGTPMRTTPPGTLREGPTRARDAFVRCRVPAAVRTMPATLIPPTLLHEIDVAVRALGAEKIVDVAGIVVPVAASPGRPPGMLATASISVRSPDGVRRLSIEVMHMACDASDDDFTSELHLGDAHERRAFVGAAPAQAPSLRLGDADRRVHLGNFVQAVRRRRRELARGAFDASTAITYDIYHAAAVALANAAGSLRPPTREPS